MPSIRKITLGAPPFRYLANQFAQDPDFLKEAQCILELDENVYLHLAKKLAETDVFLSFSDLDKLVGEVLCDDSDKVASIICKISEIVHDADMDVTDAMDALSTAINDKAESLDIQERQTLSERLRKLVAEPIGLAKQYKAQQLVDAIGAELEDFRIICDIRPIFDQKRKRIEGAIPLAILRIEYAQPDGESSVVELRLTEKQIGELGERVSDAKLKLKTIKDLLTNKQVAVPRTKSTLLEDES